ncbi:MAG: phosphatase PAP2 family protein [Amnibacterium sp.]
MTPGPAPWLPRRRALGSLAVGAGAVALCWLAGAAVAALHARPGLPVDSAARSMLEPLRAVPPLGAASEVLAVIGEEPVSIVVAVVLAVAVALRWRLPAGLAFGLASLASAGQVILMKAVVQRPGPVTAFFEGLGSFPSGHTANAAVIATVGGLLARRRWAWLVGALYVALVAVSRVVVGAHWFTDTVVGAVEGGGTALLVWAVWSLARRPAGEGRSDG